MPLLLLDDVVEQHLRPAVVQVARVGEFGSGQLLVQRGAHLLHVRQLAEQFVQFVLQIGGL